MNDGIVIMLWLGVVWLLHSSALENNAEYATEVQLDCNPSIKMICPSVTSSDGGVIQYVVKKAKVEVQDAFRSTVGKSLIHIVCREPDCLYNPCLNGGSCIETSEGFNCSCQEGYIGTRCKTSLFIQSVRLHGSQQNTNEGRVGFTSHDFPSKVRLFTNETWTMNTSHLICKHLGHTGASATVSGNVFSPDGPDHGQEYGAIRCNETAMSISDCWYDPRESDDVSLDMIIAVVCCTSPSCQPDGKLLGIRYPDVIPDSAINQSSCQDVMSCGSAGRLYSSSSSWIPSAEDFTSSWVQVSFGSLYIITGVVTQGHHEINHWVNSYTLSSSLDGDQWSEYRDAYTTSGPTVFQGNYKISSVVEQSLYPPLMTRYIRIHPQTYNLSPSLRFDLHGFGPLADYISDIYKPNMKCIPLLGDRLGVANRSIIPDSSFSASNPSNVEILKPSNGRLFGEHVWASKSQVDVGWWQVDLGVLYHVTGIISQGRELDFEGGNQWVTSYTVSISPNDTTWMNVGEGSCGIWKVFPANYDNRSLVTNLFPRPLSGRFVRLHPLSWSVWPSIRCEILGFL